MKNFGKLYHIEEQMSILEKHILDQFDSLLISERNLAYNQGLALGMFNSVFKKELKAALLHTDDMDMQGIPECEDAYMLGASIGKREEP